MLPDDLLLAPGTRLLHLGPHKTGTTTLQTAFQLVRDQLPEHGVGYFGEILGVRHLQGALAVTNRKALLGETVPAMSDWTSLTAQVAAEGDRRVLVSSEFFADADDETAARVIEGLGGRLAHIAVTLRPLTKIMPSQWQQYVQNGQRLSYQDWLDGVLNQPPAKVPTPTFWQRHRHDRLISRWAAAAGADRVTVVIVDESDRLMMLRTFERMLGLPAGLLVPDEAAANRSLTLGEVELVRLLNEEIKQRDWPEEIYARFMRRGAVWYLKTGRRPGEDEPRIVTPAWALKRAAEIGAEMADGITALGVRVVGDISSLAGTPDGMTNTRPASLETEPVLPAAAAVHAVLGAIIASKAPEQLARGKSEGARPARPEGRLVREVDAGTLARVLAGRGRRRVLRELQRALPRRSRA